MHTKVPSGSFSCPVRHTNGTGDTWVNLGSNIHARNAHTRTGHERSTRRPRAVASEHTNDGGSLHGTGTFPPRGKLVTRTCPARLLRVQWRVEEGIKASSFVFLALLCATAQQSYCRHAGVRRPSSVVRPSSVKPVFSEPVKQINAKFGGKVPFHHISRPLFCSFSKFVIFDFFYDFLSFSLTWGHMGEKTLNDILSESAQQIFSQKFMCTPGKGLYQIVQRIVKFQSFDFWHFFSGVGGWDI